MCTGKKQVCPFLKLLVLGLLVVPATKWRYCATVSAAIGGAARPHCTSQAQAPSDQVLITGAIARAINPTACMPEVITATVEDEIWHRIESFSCDNKKAAHAHPSHRLIRVTTVNVAAASESSSIADWRRHVRRKTDKYCRQ
jgi:hypothetical protein